MTKNVFEKGEKLKGKISGVTEQIGNVTKQFGNIAKDTVSVYSKINPYKKALKYYTSLTLDKFDILYNTLQLRFLTFLRNIFERKFPTEDIKNKIKIFFKDNGFKNIPKVPTEEIDIPKPCISGGGDSSSEKNRKFINMIESMYCNAIYSKKSDIVKKYENNVNNIFKKTIDSFDKKSDKNKNSEILQRLIYKYRFAIEKIIIEVERKKAENAEKSKKNKNDTEYCGGKKRKTKKNIKKKRITRKHNRQLL